MRPVEPLVEVNTETSIRFINPKRPRIHGSKVTNSIDCEKINNSDFIDQQREFHVLVKIKLEKKNVAV
jgi:hypothetical protein